jgi:hypothetical protein
VELSDRWESDATGLPTRKVPQPGIDGDVAHLAFDHCFEGWRGAARIRDEKLSLKLSSSLPYLVVFTPETRATTSASSPSATSATRCTWPTRWRTACAAWRPASASTPG